MTVIDYDVTTDGFYYRCDCGASGADHMRVQDAERDADRHDQLHEDGVI